MTAHAAEFFTLDEVNRLKIIQDVVDRRLTTQMAAQRLGISDRQCRRLLSRYRESGPLGMANRRRGKPSNNQLPDGLARYALSIIRERYADFGPSLACEKLAELLSNFKHIEKTEPVPTAIGQDANGNMIADTACAGYGWSEVFYSPRKQIEMINNQLRLRHNLSIADIVKRNALESVRA